MAVVAHELLTIAEVARCLRQSEDTIRRKVAAGELEAVRLGDHGPLRIPENALASYLRPISVATTEPASRTPSTGAVEARIGRDTEAGLDT